MSDRLGTRTPNGKITARPSLDITGKPYRWQNVSAITLRDTGCFFVVPVGYKVTPELEAELLAEISKTPSSISTILEPTPEQLAEGELPAEYTLPRAQRRKKDE